ncbi:Acetyltransferase (GNAT) family protein [Raineyella antarctica]|uniref:Acetyltransferase (GNAT) family protein n=1 Tax=Raineyella antarctica TaxID=1577474 RepID=A0A1G6HUA8_9ACTN|nr:GNAT family N-acetyltransferase [Raineyella antarctica]SDB97738.1 Acetyltransferase (GNAT) family protein [Raineyella antarctica]
MAGAQQLRVEPLQPGGVPRLPEVCDRCPLPHDRPPGTDQPWVAAAAEAYGCCGVLARIGDTPVGHILVSPPLHAPVRGPYAAAGVSPDAAVILQFYVHPEYRGRRVGRRMLEELAAMLVRRHVGGIEIRASRSDPTCLAPPEEWLLEQGFRVVRKGVFGSRLRMDLRTTRAWWPSLAEVEDGVRQLLGRPATGPEPARRGSGP